MSKRRDHVHPPGPARSKGSAAAPPGRKIAPRHGSRRGGVVIRPIPRCGGGTWVAKARSAERCPSWPKEHDWKSCVLLIPAPWVRIPLSPPFHFFPSCTFSVDAETQPERGMALRSDVETPRSCPPTRPRAIERLGGSASGPEKPTIGREMTFQNRADQNPASSLCPILY